MEEENLELLKVRLEKNIFDKGLDYEELGVQHEKLEKDKIQQIEQWQRKLDEVRVDNVKLTEQSNNPTFNSLTIELMVDRSIMVHPKSKKKEIIQL